MIEADGSPNKGNLGANAILAVSMAAAPATAATVQHACLALQEYLPAVFDPIHRATHFLSR